MSQHAENRVIGETLSMAPVSQSEPPPGPVEDPLIGQIVDSRYQIDMRLGEGGMGVVYRVSHVTLGKVLAMKVLRQSVSQNEEIVARFRQEAQSASAIGNQHIIDIIDFGGLRDGSTYFVMEFLSGRTLTEAAAHSPFTPTRAIHVCKQLCRALGAAHQRGIVHRDLKPDNVQLIERGGDADFVKVLDFGIAKVGGSTRNLTQAGQVFGTPHYMSPEQCAGDDVDPRTDIYAVGIILYELCTGAVPFDAENLMGILTKHLYEQPVPPEQVPGVGPLPAGLDSLILRCLHKDVDARYQSMGDLLVDLTAVERGDGCSAGESSAAPHPQVDRASRPAPSRVLAQAWPSIPERWQPVAAMGGTALVVFALGSWILWGGAGDAPSAAPPKAAVAQGPAETSLPPSEAGRAVAPSRDNMAVEPPQVQDVAQVLRPSQATGDAPVSAPPSARLEAIRLSSRPAGVEVYRGGALLGVTPLSAVRPTGRKSELLTLRAPGYRDKEVVLRALGPERLVVSLKRVSEAKKRRSRRAKARARRRAKAVADRAVPTTPKTAAKPEARLSKDVIDPWN